jgi:hypothetical protein
MRRALIPGLLAALSAVSFAPSAANAQAKCLEGKTASGQCVNAGLADALRQAGILFSQPKLSQTAYPVLPVDDLRYRYPNELNPDPFKPSAVGTPVPPPPP